MTTDKFTDVRVGVIGVGVMGHDHVTRITERIKGARVTAVYDFMADTAEKVAAEAGAEVFPSWEEVVVSDQVDAVLIASPGKFHAEQTIACIEAGKPVLCEKPLAMNPDDAYRVVEAEKASGSRYVSLGFMRRFDREYAELHDALRNGELGDLLVLNMKHRNADPHPSFTDSMMVYDSAVHEIDALHYFLDEKVVEVQSIMPRSTRNAPQGLHDPMILLFRTESGIIVTDELYVTTKGGYEVRTEAVGSEGTSTIGMEIGRVTTQKHDGSWGGSVHPDFRPRFLDAYDAEVREWIAAVKNGRNVAERSATAWDGYLTAATCEAAEKALSADGFVPVTVRDHP